MHHTTLGFASCGVLDPTLFALLLIQYYSYITYTSYVRGGMLFVSAPVGRDTVLASPVRTSSKATCGNNVENPAMPP